MPSKILMSACLLGDKVRYDGNDCLQTHAKLQAWIKAGKVVSICPEMAGGLPVPRPPAEIEPGKTAAMVVKGEAKIRTLEGEDVTKEYITGAQKTLALVKQHDIQVAILKSRSPSCGARQIYDGTFSHRLIEGMGLTAQLLSEHGVQVFDETEIDRALEAAEKA